MDAIAEATGNNDPAQDLDPELLRDIYARMLLTRALDVRAWALSRQGKAHFIVTGRGHEAAQVASVVPLRPGSDMLFPYYRDLGVGIAIGMTAREVMLGVFARAADPSRAGRQLPMHLSKRALQLVSGSSVTGTQIPHAVGAALAMRYRGEENVAVAYFGEATTSKGDFHEAVNFASVHRLPVIFFCENNGYGISVPKSLEMAVAHVADRAAAYGILGVVVEGRDPVAVLSVMRDAVDRARSGGGPTLIDADCDRLTAHTSDDNETLYRTPEEMAEAHARDPIPAFCARLRRLGVLDDAGEAKLRAETDAAVDDAVDFAEASPRPTPEDALTHVLAGSDGEAQRG